MTKLCVAFGWTGEWTMSVGGPIIPVGRPAGGVGGLVDGLTGYYECLYWVEGGGILESVYSWCFKI